MLVICNTNTLEKISTRSIQMLKLTGMCYHYTTGLLSLSYPQWAWVSSNYVPQGARHWKEMMKKSLWWVLEEARVPGMWGRSTSRYQHTQLLQPHKYHSKCQACCPTRGGPLTNRMSVLPLHYRTTWTRYQSIE